MDEFNLTFTNMNLSDFNYKSPSSISDLSYIHTYCEKATHTMPLYTFISFFILSAFMLYMNRKNKEGLHIDMVCLIIMIFSIINIMIQLEILT
jgi:hypothetical protein